MRINKYVAQATGLSRRAADEAILDGRIHINGSVPEAGQQVAARDLVTLDKKPISIDAHKLTILLHKPVGYVCSRDGQGSQTVYDLLPSNLHHLKPVGRLDKDSSGLLLMTNDGQLAHQLTHPRFEKVKQYEVTLDKHLREDDFSAITNEGVLLEDGISKLQLTHNAAQQNSLTVSMSEGRNRQIRRTFAALGYKVTVLHRTVFGEYRLADIPTGSHRAV